MHLQKVKNEAIAKIGTGRKDRVLVVDDDRNTRELVVKILTAIGYDAVPAQDASEALDLLVEMSFDLVLTDLQMPGMDGWELAERIKEQAVETRIVLMTGANEEMVREKMSRSSADAVIFKPFDIKEIQEAINHTFDA